MASRGKTKTTAVFVQYLCLPVRDASGVKQADAATAVFAERIFFTLAP